VSRLWCLARPSFVPCFLAIVLLLVSTPCVVAQQPTEAQLREAARRAGMSEEELRRYQDSLTSEPGVVDTVTVSEPGRTTLDGIDDSVPAGQRPLAPDPSTQLDPRFFPPKVVLPFELDGFGMSAADSDSVYLELTALEDSVVYFGADFFQLDAGMFNPPSFGPVPADYLIGVGDHIVVDVWGEVEFRLSRVVDREGTIILPKGGKILCQNRTLEQVRKHVENRLAQSYSGIQETENEATTFVDVNLGALRAIRVFVVGDAQQPGSYELSSVATVFTALYAAGGPSTEGTMRDIRLVRDGEVVTSLDVYEYLLSGKRTGDTLLREGDTILIGARGPSVRVQGEVRRPIHFEMRPGENISELIRFAGGFTPQAASAVVHIERILPFAERRDEQPDQVYLDVVLDPLSGEPVDPASSVLVDGDTVTVGAIVERLENWIEIIGNVKRPGTYQFRPGMVVSDLIDLAGGMWPDTLKERAIIDRTTPQLDAQTFDFALGDVLEGRAEPVHLQAMDVVHIFSRWDIEERHLVHVSGEVREPQSMPYREGMTLRDLVLKAGGLKQSADKLRAEVSRVRLAAVESHDLSAPPTETVDAILVELGEDFLTSSSEFVLQAHDRVAIRKLPWWELQRTVTLVGEVYFPGLYSLERPDETLSEVIARAGGLKPSAYWIGARVLREKDDVGNIAIDLQKALAEPRSQYDIIVQSGDIVLVPDQMYTVKVMGEVGFPTSLVFEEGRDLNYYVDRAGGYLEDADKKKTRVVYPNGLSLPNKGGSRVVAGSTIVVPLRKEGDWGSRLEYMREISAIFASLATVWLVIDKTTQ